MASADVTIDARSAALRDLNDRLRCTGIGGLWVITGGVQALGPVLLRQAVAAVKAFDSFDLGNDPYGEHDFGKVEVAGVELFWKVDVYDLALSGGADDPTDPSKSRRVLTLMLAEEY